MREVKQHYIDGRFSNSHGTEILDIHSPTDGSLIGRVTLGDAVDTQRAIEAARVALPTYAKSSPQERGELLQRLHDALLARLDEHIAIRTLEYGGVSRHNRFSIAGAAKVFLNMKQTLARTSLRQTFGEAEVLLRPVGVAGLITPWNSAIFMVCNKLAPALAAGCTVVIKPSELSPLQTQLLVECIDAAGLPPGVVNVVIGRGEVVGQSLVTHPDVAKISFTGSTAVGKDIMRSAAATMKRLTLELGGKSAHIVLDDAELDKAIPFALSTIFMNNGQACIAGSRLLVPARRFEEIKSALVEGMKPWKVGDPADEDTLIGPLVSEKQFVRVQGYIRKGIEEGAEILVGGEGKPAGLERGHFAKPTIFVNVTNEMTIAREEIFGPVLSVLTYETEDDAIRIANDSPYGLQGWISTANPLRGAAVAERIEAGILMVNRVYDMLDEAGAPAGGFKQSGFGKEFGAHGLDAYLEKQSVFA